MDFLNKSLAQLSELFRSMTPGARVTAGLLLAVVVVSVGYLFQQSATGPDAYLFGGEPLSGGQLDRVEAAIAQGWPFGLPARRHSHSRASRSTGQYLAAVADARRAAAELQYDSGKRARQRRSLGIEREARERLKIARQQTLSEIVRAMPWVENAVVLYDEHESRGMRELATRKQVTASVSVKPIVGEIAHADAG